MKLFGLWVVLLLLIIPLSMAADLEVETIRSDATILLESDDNATFTLRIENKELQRDSFEIFSLAGVTIFPKEPFFINAGGTKSLDIIVVPQEHTKENRRGFFIFEYQIKGKNTGFYKDNLMVNFIELVDTVELSSTSVNLEEDNVVLTITNLQDYDLEDLTVNARSLFFDFEKTLDLDAEEEKKYSVPINKEGLQGLAAGEYKIDVTLTYNDNAVEKLSQVSFLERGDTTTTTESSGLILRKTLITKTNSGNIASSVTINERKDALSRLFTTFSKRPEIADRNGFYVDYSWTADLQPGESYEVEVTTNYTLPFVILLVIIVLIVLIRFWLTNKPVLLQKRVSPVKTKGGELALKVKLRIKARKSISNVTIMDRLPHVAKLYEKFGTKPDKIHHKTRQLEWNLKHLTAGEERTFTYIIYSKLNVVGRFELPSARAAFTLKDKPQEVYSNKTSLAAETAEYAED